MAEPQDLTQEQARDVSIEDIVRDLEIFRVRYFMPDTSAYVRYQPEFDHHPDELTVHVDPAPAGHVAVEETGRFRLPDLVNELELAYILVHLFPSPEARDYFIAGFDGALAQLDFIGGNYDLSRLWITKGTSNLGLPVAIFLGQRNAVNNQPSVSLIDHRSDYKGRLAYRAIRGSGTHVGEEFFTAS
jgi:hypothetical protein